MVHLIPSRKVTVGNASLAFSIIPSPQYEGGLLLCTEIKDGKERTVSIASYRGSLENQVRVCVEEYRKEK